ncbi:hypothetical protein LTS17_009597 [Exophiala oligosperma]
MPRVLRVDRASRRKEVGLGCVVIVVVVVVLWLTSYTPQWTTLPEPTPKGQIGGHEGVGYIVKLGSETANSQLKLGDRVGIKWIADACGHCQACQAQSDGLCFNQQISGYFFPGTFQQFVVSPAHYVTPIPDGLDSAQAAPILCAGLTVYSALKRCKAQSGQWVVIQGAGGGLGHLAVQLASRGIGLRVVGVDHPSKAELVLSCGAEHFVDVTQFPREAQGNAIVSHVRTLCDGLGAPAVIVCTASNEAYAQGLRFLRFNGTMVCVGMPEGGEQAIASASPGSLIANHYTITGSAVGTRQESIEALEFAARGTLKASIRIEPMEALTSIFRDMEQGRLQGRVVLDLT